jgi:predicted acylesterase/phospholipase RssA
MSQNLLFLAGENAYKKIRENGLSPDDIEVCVSASGAAKWLALYGLDKSVFGSWLNNRKSPAYFFGTSIGAWKFAAACQNNSSRAFDILADKYIAQRYGKKITKEDVSETAQNILDEFLPPDKINEILNHPYYRISFSAVRCRKQAGNENSFVQSAALFKAAFLNFVKREYLARYFERTFFMDKRDIPPFASVNGFPINRVFLNNKNFKKALLASGSIPLVMKGVTEIDGAPNGVYRDGGMIDYHPVFNFNGKNKNKIVLYTHFYKELIPGWFDKKFSNRRAGRKDLKDVLLLSPSEEFVSSLPEKRIPDRKDFNRLSGQDEKRISMWTESKEKSLVLGKEFLDAVESGNIKNLVKKI